MTHTRKERHARTARLLPSPALDILWDAHVMIFGLGGVGSYAAEALCRSGIGKLTLVDADTVALSNLNRQLPALHSTLGQPKVQVVQNRLLDIAPDAQIEAIQAFYLPENPVPLPKDVSFVVDAIDTVSAKLHLASICHDKNIPLVSCMGMGNRLDPTQIRIGDIFETVDCPLCRVMRRELRRLHIPSLRCVYSAEKTHVSPVTEETESRASGRPAPGSVAYVPSVAGLYLAYDVVNRLCGAKM